MRIFLAHMAALPATFAAARREAASRVIAMPRWAAWLLVSAFVALAAIWLAHYALHNFLVQPDEELYVSDARYVGDAFPHSLLAFAHFAHGLQRLNVFLLAIVLAVAHAPSSFALFHVLNCLAFASAAIPAYLLARTLGARDPAALIAALLAVLVPWAVVSASLLAEGIAYPVFAWVVLAMTRSVGASSRRRDAVAVSALAIAPLARTSFLVLPGAYVLSLIIQSLKYAEASSASARFRKLPVGLWRDHRVVCLSALAGTAFLLACVVAGPGLEGPIRQLTGSYYSVTGTSYPLHVLLDRSGYFLSRVTIGVGVLPVVIGLPWLVVQSLSRVRAEHSAFGLVAVTSTIAVLLTSSTSTPDERYVMYLAPALIVGCVLAIDIGGVPPRAVALGGLLAAWLLYHYGSIYQGSSAFSYFIFPAGSFSHYTVSRLRHGLGLGLSVSTAGALLALALTAVSVYVVARGRRRQVVAVCVGVALVAAQLLQTWFAVTRFVNKGAAGNRATQASLSWIDRATHGSGWAFLPVGEGATTRYVSIWRTTQFWNPDVVGPLDLQGVRHSVPTVGYVRSDPAAIDGAGLLHAAFPIPRYVAVPAVFHELGIAGAPVARATDLPVVLVRRREPASLQWQVFGADPDGWLEAGRRTTIRFFRAGLVGNLCAEIGLTAAPGQLRPRRYVIAGEDFVGVGDVPAGARATVEVPLNALGRGAAREDLRIVVRGHNVYRGARQVTLGISGASVLRCPP